MIRSYYFISFEVLVNIDYGQPAVMNFGFSVIACLELKLQHYLLL
jgi:hypothetical protein